MAYVEQLATRNVADCVVSRKARIKAYYTVRVDLTIPYGSVAELISVHKGFSKACREDL